MFGLSKKERLIKAVKKACIVQLPIFESAFQSFLSTVIDTQNYSDIDFGCEVILNRHTYLDAVKDMIWEPLEDSVSLSVRLNFALYTPSVTGLPNSYNIDGLGDFGIPAGIVFAVAYFCLTNKPINEKDMKTLSDLNQYQNNLMGTVLKKYM